MIELVNGQKGQKPKGGNEDPKKTPSGPEKARLVLTVDLLTTPQGVMVTRVNGFPNNWPLTINIVTQIPIIINKFFTNKFNAGELDEKLSIIQSKIVTPGKNIVVPNLVPPNKTH